MSEGVCGVVAGGPLWQLGTGGHSGSLRMALWRRVGSVWRDRGFLSLVQDGREGAVHIWASLCLGTCPEGCVRLRAWDRRCIWLGHEGSLKSRAGGCEWVSPTVCEGVRGASSLWGVGDFLWDPGEAHEHPGSPGPQPRAGARSPRLHTCWGGDPGPDSGG